MDEITGWLLDLYEDGERGLALWFIAEDGRRLCLHQAFPLHFYAAGPAPRLREAWQWLGQRPDPPKLARESRRDLFQPQPIPVLAVEARHPAEQRALFAELERAFPDLTYYDADVQVQIRHAARYGSFSLAHCRVSVDAQLNVHAFQTLDSRWDLDPEPPPLTVLEINVPGESPLHENPVRFELRCGAWKRAYELVEGSAPAYWLKAALGRFDPDILITDYGDTWLLENLLARVKDPAAELPLSRDPARTIHTIREKTYFSYGQVVYRGQQVHLFGRIHIDRKNAMMWGDYGMEGILENARVTALPIQTAARVSPGSGISCMQMITALRGDILVPWHKQQVEQPRPLIDMIHADFGGLVYQPTVGLHRDVAALDFVSLYPAVMVRCNISPEKTALSLSDPPPDDPGLVPQTLAPLLKKRVLLKQRLPGLPAWDPRRKWYKARTSAHKWLLVVCFGYLGYKNARFGLIGSHEAVTAGGREALMRAKEAAEDAGFAILHLFVDALWVQRKDCTRPEDFQALQDEITRRTGLPIALDGVYRWVVFLPSRADSRIPVGNRYFGAFQDGAIKVRGLDARRRDTAPWVANTQMALIEYLARAPDADCLPDYLPGALALLRRALQRLNAGRVRPEDLLTAQRLSRPPEKYTTLSPSARAALQLRAAGKEPQAGQRIRLLYVYGKPGVWAWDRPEAFDARRIDLRVYRKLMLRAAADVFQPFGIRPEELAMLVEGDFVQPPLSAARAGRKIEALRGLESLPVVKEAVQWIEKSAV
ncbi:DNA polymerase elongation subunit [Longilinea arvoryzae]|uniref:DNA-directed DNA polymerase n=1 Tax=Longilinea arvoryzae TaxID=360412 RepID=A0A0S7BK49_9CHLR|nr:DNA polymerase domain-containing protein [Longilinea arvoryzae]GAP14331.1 DNA polymerase elongation subunit [Longilinea arvoryzae]